MSSVSNFGVNEIIIAGFGLLITIVGFFLAKFYNQFEKQGQDITEIKISYTEIKLQQKTIEIQFATFRQYIQQKINDLEKHNQKS